MQQTEDLVALQIEYDHSQTSIAQQLAIAQTTQQLLDEQTQTVLECNAFIEQLQGQICQLQDDHAAESTRLQQSQAEELAALATSHASAMALIQNDLHEQSMINSKQKALIKNLDAEMETQRKAIEKLNKQEQVLRDKIAALQTDNGNLTSQITLLKIKQQKHTQEMIQMAVRESNLTSFGENLKVREWELEANELR